jgi:uncharacterized CHY-type Zn-finger protein
MAAPRAVVTVEQEKAMLQRLYGGRFEATVGVHGSTYKIKMKSTDKDVAMDVGMMELEAGLPVGYPDEVAAIRIVDAQAPSRIIAALNVIIAHQCNSTAWQGAPMVKKCLQWMDNHMSDLINEVITVQGSTFAREMTGTAVATAGNAADCERKNDAEILVDIPVLHAADDHQSVQHNSELERTDSGALWTYEQQFCLEKALRDVFYRAYHDVRKPESWKLVAAATGLNKSPADCLLRFLVIRRIAVAWKQQAYPEGVSNDQDDYSSALSDASAPAEVVHRDEIAEYAFVKAQPAGGRTGHRPARIFADDLDDSDTTDSDRENPVPISVKEAMEYGPADIEGDAAVTVDYAEESPIVPFSGLHLAPTHAGTRVVFESSSAFGLGTVAANRMQVSLQCDRCSTLSDVSMLGVTLHSNVPDGSAALSTEHKAWCAKCSLLHVVNFRPTYVHEGNPSPGYIDTTHCVVTGLLDAGLYATCLECNSIAEIPHFRPPMTWEAACRCCFGRLRLEVRGVAFEIATRENAAAKAFDPRSLTKTQRFQPGRHLPAEGTCSHFRQSYRWLRFPCCGVAFPCPICHDENSDHPHEYAKRMICGRCAKEQPFGNTPCVACGQYMTRKSGPLTRFWEGGSGQRNRAFMSRKDPRKYKDQAKTKSRRSTRTEDGKPRAAAVSKRS